MGIGSGLSHPEILIYSDNDAQNFLAEHGLETHDGIKSIVVFKLPKPLSEFWGKSTNTAVYKPSKSDEYEQETDAFDQNFKNGTNDRKIYGINGMAIEYGNIYLKLRNIPWEVLSRIKTEYEDYVFERLNPVGHHTEDFYYVLGIAKRTTY